MKDLIFKAHDYYMAYQEDIIRGHLGEFVVIHKDHVLGYYKNFMDGLNAAVEEKKLVLGTFIVHKCRPIGEPDIEIAGVDILASLIWKH